MRKFFIPPLSVPLITFLMSLYVIISEESGPPRYIHGHIDNAPIRAAFIFLFMTPFIYVFAMATNALDEFLSRLVPRHKWISTLALVALSTMGFCFLQFRYAHADEFRVSESVMLALSSAVFFVPSAIVRFALARAEAKYGLTSLSSIFRHFKANYEAKYQKICVIIIGGILLVGFVALVMASGHK